MTSSTPPAPRPSSFPSPASRPAASRDRRPPTRWGDRAGRRQDILDAARAQIVSGGYLALNMRDIAAGAGVSPGTLYSYFATKEEIFATLYAEAIEQHNEEVVAPLCERATDLEAFLTELIASYLDMHRTYGRYFSMWAALATEGEGADGPLPADLTRALRRATIRQGEMTGAVLRRLLPGPHPPGETRRRLAFLWSVQNGLADHLHSERHRLSGVESDELIAYAARIIAAGLRLTDGSGGSSRQR